MNSRWRLNTADLVAGSIGLRQGHSPILHLHPRPEQACTELDPDAERAYTSPVTLAARLLSFLAALLIGFGPVVANAVDAPAMAHADGSAMHSGMSQAAEADHAMPMPIQACETADAVAGPAGAASQPCETQADCCSGPCTAMCATIVTMPDRQIGGTMLASGALWGRTPLALMKGLGVQATKPPPKQV